MATRKKVKKITHVLIQHYPDGRNGSDFLCDIYESEALAITAAQTELQNSYDNGERSGAEFLIATINKRMSMPKNVKPIIEEVK